MLEKSLSNKMKLFSILIFICFHPLIANGSSLKNVPSSAVSQVTYLEPEETEYVVIKPKHSGFFSNELHIYCYRGVAKSLTRVFQTVLLYLEIDDDDFTQYEGSTPEIVKENYDQHTTIFHYFLSSKKTRLKLNPFNQTCIGIDTIQEYHVKLQTIRIDFWKVTLLAIGLLIFMYAGVLSHNSLFYYLTGILVGIFASLLIVVYFASKLVPRRPMMFGVVLCGWSLAIYLIQMLWENIQVILVTYQTYVFWYILLTGFISFVICYRFGPPENQKSKDLIKWGLQLVSLIMVYFSSEFQEASAAIVILTLFIYYFPRKWLRGVQSFYIRRFPPKPILLTSEEYYEQGVRETTKALDDLRKYANSPECKQWKIVTKLKDPLRFASFIEGSSHISDQEILEYETSRADMTDSDELSEDEEAEEVVQNNISSSPQQNNNDINEISEDEEFDNNQINSYNRRDNSRSTTKQVESRLRSMNGINLEQNRNRMYYSNYGESSTDNQDAFERRGSYRSGY